VAVVSSAPPASVVFCIDNSAGMAYRYQGQTRVQAAIDWARSVMEDGRYLGPGSQFAVVSGTPSPGMEAWREDRRATGRLLDTIRPAGHNLPAAHLLGRAYGLLSTARHERREVHLFNDLTESSWMENPPPAPDSLTALYIMDAGQDENRNVALSWAQIPPHELPAGAPASIAIRVINGDLPSEPVLQFSIDGVPRGRQSAGPLPPNSQTEVILNLPALEPGPHALVVELEPADALAFDNKRFGWLMAGALPRVGLLQNPASGPGGQDTQGARDAQGKRGERGATGGLPARVFTGGQAASGTATLTDGQAVGGTGAASEVGRMVEAMIAPPQLHASQQRYHVKHIPLETLLSHKLDEMIAIVMADVKGLNGLAWAKLSDYVRAGGTLILIPGPSLAPGDYTEGAAILPASIEAITACDPPLRPAISNLSHPYLTPFADLSIDSVNDRHAFQRLSLGQISPQATVVFSFSDGSPALLESTPGNGRTLLIAFSPAADWGQFGTQAAPTIVLLHRILETVRPPLRNVAAFAAGRPPLQTVGDGTAPLLIHSALGDEHTVMPSNGRLYALPADIPQLYSAAEKSAPQDSVLYYSVNVAESESQFARLAGDTLKSRFDSESVRVVRPGDPLEIGTGTGPQRVNWAVPLGVILIGLLLVESSFSNRFYRSGRH
jgi:hypothetical protein